MKNKKGFTLIELLAVIVILAIIALIAVPIVLNMINSARKSAARSAALGYIDAIEYNNGFASLGSDAEVSGYTKITSGDVSEITSTLGSHLKGKAPTSGSVVIDSNGKVESATDLCFNGYKVQYDGKDAKVEGKCSSNANNDTPSQTVYYYRDASDKKTKLDSSWVNYIKEIHKQVKAEADSYEQQASNNGTIMHSSDYGYTYSSLEECQNSLLSNDFECVIYHEKGSLYDSKELEVCLNSSKYGGELCIKDIEFNTMRNKIKTYFNYNDETGTSSYGDIECTNGINLFGCDNSLIKVSTDSTDGIHNEPGLYIYDYSNNIRCGYRGNNNSASCTSF